MPINTYIFIEIKINGFYLGMNARNINTNIDQLIPKYEMTHQVDLVMDLSFLLFSVDSLNKTR